MINGATVTLAGYVATEPNYRLINDKTPVVSMRVAWTARYIDRDTGEWRDGKTSYANVNCWRKLAGNAAPSLRKGHAVVLIGRLQVRDYEDKEGRRRISVDIDADAIGHDLTRGVTHFQRTGRSPEEAAGQPDGAAAAESFAASLEADGDQADGSGDALAGLPAGGEGAGSLDVGDVLNEDAVSELAGHAASPVGAAAPF